MQVPNGWVWHVQNHSGARAQPRL